MRRRQFILALGVFGAAAALAPQALTAEPVMAEITGVPLVGGFSVPPIAKNRAAVLSLGGAPRDVPDPKLAAGLAREW